MAIGLRKKRRIQIVIAGAVLLVLATGLIGYAMRSGIEFFRTPSSSRVSLWPTGGIFAWAASSSRDRSFRKTARCISS